MDEEKVKHYRELASFSNVIASDAREFCEGQAFKFILDYIEKGEIDIPFLGKLKITHVKDKKVKGKVVAQIETEFSPEEFLIKCIGQHADGIETEAEKLYLDKNLRLLNSELRS